jgi:hypothetical protein
MRINNDDQIRTRLFRTLGIDAVVAESKTSRGGVAATKTQPEVPVEGGIPHKQPLKIGDESSPSPKKGSRIQFNTMVTVVPIPSHSQYSDIIKKVIWSNSAEIKQNAQRNLREFAAEGWNWKKVLEEEEMFLDKLSNERIHPVHLGGIMDLR